MIKDIFSLFEILHDHGIKAKFVGGYVRDVLLGRTPKDIDIAFCGMEPEKLIRILQDSLFPLPSLNTFGLRFGGFAFKVGSITVQLTHLRQDFYYDGRLVKVNLTTDWEVDAKRRDFTINALYQDIEGHIYDPYEGHRDLTLGKVRFIGDPNQRIREDYSRLWRYYRFWSSFSSELSPEMLPLHIYKEGLLKLSRFCIQREFRAYVITHRVVETTNEIQEFFHLYVDQPLTLEALKHVIDQEKSEYSPPNALLRLYAMWSDKEVLHKILLLSKKEEGVLRSIITNLTQSNKT